MHWLLWFICASLLMLILRRQHSYFMKRYWAQINKPPSQLNHMKGGQGAFDRYDVWSLISDMQWCFHYVCMQSSTPVRKCSCCLRVDNSYEIGYFFMWIYESGRAVLQLIGCFTCVLLYVYLNQFCSNFELWMT